MKRLIVKFAIVFGVLFLTFPVRDAYSFSYGWDPNSLASRFLGLITYLFFAGISLKGGLAWYAGLSGIVTGAFLVGDLFLGRLKLEVGSIFEKARWRSGATKPLALLTLLLTGILSVWALLMMALFYLNSTHEIALMPTHYLLDQPNILEPAGWGALMLLATWPIGWLLTRNWCK